MYHPKYFTTLLKILVITVLVIVNIVIFRNRVKEKVSKVAAEGRTQVLLNSEPPTSDIIPTQTEANHIEHVIQARFDERKMRVHLMCTSKNSKPAKITQPTDFIGLPSLGLIWCPIFKAGSTNWLDLFCRNNFPDDDGCKISTIRRNNPLRNLLNNKDRFHFVADQSTGVPFMTVRNPVTRFLSAYRNKLQHARIFNYYSSIGENAVNMFREVDVNQYNHKSEYLSAAREIIMKKEHLEAGFNSSDNPYLNPPGPTFREFVQWALAGGMDNHIKPFYKHCAPCAVDYTVLKLEKLNEESDYLFRKIERSYLNLDFKTSLNVMGNTDECMVKYYSSLKAHELENLYIEFLEVDCELYKYACRKFVDSILNRRFRRYSEDIKC